MFSRFSFSRSSRILVVSGLAAICLPAHATTPPGDDPFADTVISYEPGSNPSDGFTTPETAIGSPERFSGEGIFPGVVSVFNSAWRPDELVSIGAGGHLTVHFDTPVTDDPNNLHGIDLLIFSNSFLFDLNYPDGICGVPCAVASEGGIIEVSADGTTWHTVPDIVADGPFPTQGYNDSGAYDPIEGRVPSDFTRPVDPDTMPLFDGGTYDDILTLYNGSGGGTPIDLATVGIPAISYVRISNPIGAFDSPEIDAIADVAPRTPGDVNLDDLVDVNDLLGLLAAWGPSSPGDPPADFNNDDTVDVLDLLALLGELVVTRRTGFTLVEMMVVVGIVALLVGMLAPALGRVRDVTRSVECQANLRQMVIAATNYSVTWDRYPTALRYDSVDGQFQQVAWDWVTTFDGQVISPGPLWNLSDNPDRVQQCPAYHGHSNTSADPYTGYNYNTTYIGGEASGFTPGWEDLREGVSLGAYRRTETCAMFGCGGYAGGANKFMRAPMDSEGQPLNQIYSGGQAFRHYGTTNVGYVDGHVASHNAPKRGKHATAELLDDFLGFPRNGFLSDDDSAYDPR